MKKIGRSRMLCLLAALMLALGACGEKETETAPSAQTTQATTVTAGDTAYGVTVRTQGGMAMTELPVYVYSNEAMTELVYAGMTDGAGAVSLTLPAGGDYYIELGSVPKGYRYEPFYRFDGDRADITLTSALIEGDSLSGASLGLGDVMYDFTVELPDGTSLRLSELLAEKKAVLLNFFYTTCGPCANEFPYMQQAYETYQDTVGVLALDPLEDNTAVSLFQSSLELTFPMAACPSVWSQTFAVTGYPTSVIIDRYGVICLIEVGSVTSVHSFNTLFAHFTAENYEQALFGSLSELVSAVKPTFTMASSQEVSRILGSQALDVTYRPETEGESAEYSWPFIEAEKLGQTCLKASNQTIDGSYAILYADIYLEQGQAVGFDYLSSTEKSCDILYVIVDGQDVCAISGWDGEETWKSCYPWVALESGYHEIALCYLKDSDTSEGDDTVYLKNLRVVSSEQIDVPTYIPQEAARDSGDFNWTYVQTVYSEKDGYYHVGSPEGPLLLADMMNYTQFYEEKTLWELCYEGTVNRNGENIYQEMVQYFSYASNSQLYGVCPVNQELAQWLQLVDTSAGFSQEDGQEWLQLCRYYQPYGTDVQLSDPIAGLARFSAYEAVLGEGNYFYYDRPIMPRGLLAEFVPERSGVYRISSTSESSQGCEGWIFSEDPTAGNYTYAADARMVADVENVYMLYYMEAGKSYYIDIAFWDIYEVGYIYYTVEYVAEEAEVLRLCSPGYFTYDADATGDAMYHLIAGGVDVMLGEDGFYYEDLGNGTPGSLIYADFTGVTGLFNTALTTVNAYDAEGNVLLDDGGEPVRVPGVIEKGGFDFSKTENDLYILGILEAQGGDPDAAVTYLKKLWGEDYEKNAENYQLEDVLAGIYHGRGEDYTQQILAYAERIITTGPEELWGCVPVDGALAELLQLVMDKYTFGGVDNSWTKLCYYYDYIGPKDR